MKKVLKKIIVCIAITYLIFSIGCNIFLKGGCTEQKKGIEEEAESYQVVVGQDYTFKNVMIENIDGRIAIININLTIIIISIIVGTIVGLIASVKENSKIKYILYFIFGAIIYNILWTIIISIIYDSYNLINVYEFYNIFDTFIYSFKNTFISYILIYIIIILVNIIKMKVQINKLNENLNIKEVLKNKRKLNDTTKKKIIKILIGIVVTIILIIVVIITRRTIILVKYSEAINKMSKCENYYKKEETIFNNSKDEILITETYYKNGIYLIKLNNNSITYQNEAENEAFSIREDIKDGIIFENPNIKYKFQNFFYFDNYVRIWQNIILAFQINIQTEECDGKSCYLINTNNTQLYIDTQTYLVVKEITTSEIQRYDYETDELKEQIYTTYRKYDYKINAVKDEDVQRPDITQYNMQRVNKDGKMV